MSKMEDIFTDLAEKAVTHSMHDALETLKDRKLRVAYWTPLIDEDTVRRLTSLAKQTKHKDGIVHRGVLITNVEDIFIDLT